MLRPPATDVALAVLLTAAAVAVTARWLDDVSDLDRTVDTTTSGLIVVAGLALAWRRRRPVLVLAVVTAATTAYLWIGYPYGPVLALVAVAAYSVARHCPSASAAWACGVALAVLLTHLLVNDAAFAGWVGLVPATAWIVVPWAVGTTRRTLVESAELARAEAVRSRLDEQRLHLAQEVHDVVGHGLAAIQMQADVALHVLDRSPDQGEQALRSISRTASEAFDELRATLHVLRPDDRVDLSPAPGLGRVDDLCSRIRATGVDVVLEVHGAPPSELPATVDLAAYRLLQEALTNVVRHGPVPEATVVVHWEPNLLELTVTNPGSSARVDRGTGITGMRHRAAALGGSLDAGSTTDGFRVVARLPTGIRA